MTELQAFIKMLTRAGIGHGTRTDYNPPGTGVQVEFNDDSDRYDGTGWQFNEAGELVSVVYHDDLRG